MSGRPYSRIGGTEPSVTTIIGDMLGKPGLPWAAARETALFAVHHRDEWSALGAEDAVDLLRRHHRGVWDSRAAMGTAAHAVNEAWCRGETVDLGAMVQEMAATERQARSWAGREDEVVAALDGYVAGLERFWTDWAPETVAVEYVVRTPGAYIGTADWCAVLDGRPLLLDIKTTAQQEGDKGIYHDSWALQLAAYRFGVEAVTYAPDDKGRLAEVGTGAVPETAGAAVIHLRGDGDYALLPLEADRAMHETFLNLAAARARLRALPVPAPIRKAVPA